MVKCMKIQLQKKAIHSIIIRLSSFYHLNFLGGFFTESGIKKWHKKSASIFRDTLLLIILVLLNR